MELEEITRELTGTGLVLSSLEDANAQREFFLPVSKPFTPEDRPYWFTFNYRGHEVCVEISDDKCFNLPGEPEKDTYHIIHAAASGLDALYTLKGLRTEKTKRAFANYLGESFELPWAAMESGDFSTTAISPETIHKFLACEKAFIDAMHSDEYYHILCKDSFQPENTDLELRELARKVKENYEVHAKRPQHF